MAKRRGCAEKFADLEGRPRKDFDPEAELSREESQSDAESSHELQGTEHYVHVGKGTLRQKDALSLDPRYSGSQVSRSAFPEYSVARAGPSPCANRGEKYDAPVGSSLFEAYPPSDQLGSSKEEGDKNIDGNTQAIGEKSATGTEIGSVSEFSQLYSPDSRRTCRPKAWDWIEQFGDELDPPRSNLSGGPARYSPESGGEIIKADDEDVDMDSTLPPNHYDGLHNGYGTRTRSERGSSRLGAERRDLVSHLGAFDQGAKSATGRLGAIAWKEATQGVAYRRQRKAFDSILNLRVRLQKSLVASNLLQDARADTEQGQVCAAEEAALKLWNDLDALKLHLQPSSNKKRKRHTDSATASSDMWESMSQFEKQAVKLRKANLEKWSDKADRGSMASSRNGLKAAAKETISAYLEGQLAKSGGLIKDLQERGSCAPSQAKGLQPVNGKVYDDADFYRLLLKELLEERTASESSSPSRVTTVVYATQMKAKKPRVVDTKASKGRKLRFDVHSKLVNFMPGEDKRTWEKSAIDRLLGSFFGKKHWLGDDDDGSEAEDDVADF